MESGGKWIFLVYDVPNSPSKIRVKFWRKLKKMGAIYPPYSICILPDNHTARKKVKTIRKEIEKHGFAAIFVAKGEKDVDEINITKMFEEERKRELNEILEECDEFIKEIQYNIENDNMTVEEVEELEESLEGLNRWYEKVISRSISKVGDRTVEEALRRCSEMLNSFTEIVQKKESENWRKKQTDHH